MQETAATLRAALLGPAPKATALVASRRLDHRLLEREHSRLVPGMSIGDLSDFGERLSGLLLPPEIAEALPSVKSAPLVVVHDTASAHWPWEVLSLGGWAPAGAMGLSRRYAAEGMSVAKWREQRRRAREFNVLLVVNPTGDLPGAVEEGERVAAMLTQVQGAGITAIRGAEATRARLLAEFRSGDYDAIHFAGHAWFDAAAPASSGILCAGGRVLSGADLAAMDSVPALVFFNACESGRLRATVNPLRQLDRSVGFRGGLPARRRRELHRHLVAGVRPRRFRVRRHALPRPGPRRVDRRRAERGARCGACAALRRLGELPALRQLRLHPEDPEGVIPPWRASRACMSTR